MKSGYVDNFSDTMYGECMKSTSFLTDMYELSMIQSALKSGTDKKKTVFELFARRLPEGRRYGVVAGTSRAIEAIKNFKFTPEQISFLKEEGFSEDLLNWCQNFTFKGSVSGLREGDVFFPYTPILMVEGEFAECVVIETLLLSILNYDSAVASASARMVQASGGVPIMDMGSRRTSEHSAIYAARAAYLTGFSSTSNLEAGLRYGIPVKGTSAHAFTLLYPSEVDAFTSQVESLGPQTTLLVDTYNIADGVDNAYKVAGDSLGAIRIDSGDLYDEVVKARQQLDSLGAVNTKISVSSDLDEYSIREMIERKTPVDFFGAGTRVVIGSGHPTSGMVYKLVAREPYEGETPGVDGLVPVAKKASGKGAVGGRKFLYREYDSEGTLVNEFYTVGSPVTFDELNRYSTREKTTVRSHCVEYIKDGEFLSILSLDELRREHAQTMRELPVEALHVTFGEPAFTSQRLEIER